MLSSAPESEKNSITVEDFNKEYIPLCFRAELMEHFSEVTEILKALAHDHRLLIVSLLCEEPKCVRKIELTTGLRQSVVSQQLSRLRAAGLVKAQRNGKNVYYCIANKKIHNLILFLREQFAYSRSLTDQDTKVASASSRDEQCLEAI